MHDNIIEQYAEEKGLSRSDTGVLIKMEKAAQQLGPDRHLYNLTKPEIVDYLSNLQLSSYTSVRKYVSMIKVFITYCMNIGAIPQGENVGDTFSQQEMESCLSVYKFHTKQLSKELIEEFVHFLENPSDQFMVLGSFEGFSLAEFVEINQSNFDFQHSRILKPKNKIWFTYSDQLMYIGEKALNAHTYYGGRTAVELSDPDPYKPSLIKIGWGGKRPNVHALNNRMMLRASEFGHSFLTLKLIQSYGFCHALEQNVDGLPVKDFIDNRNLNYREVLARYGKELKRPYEILKTYKTFAQEE